MARGWRGFGVVPVEKEVYVVIPCEWTNSESYLSWTPVRKPVQNSGMLSGWKLKNMSAGKVPKVVSKHCQ